MTFIDQIQNYSYLGQKIYFSLKFILLFLKLIDYLINQTNHPNLLRHESFSADFPDVGELN